MRNARTLLAAATIVATACSSHATREDPGRAVPLTADARWAYAYSSAANDLFGDVAADDAGNAIVAWWDGGLRAVRVEKRDPLGALSWERQFPAQGGASGAPRFMLLQKVPSGAVELALAPGDTSASFDLGNGPCSGGQRARLDRDGRFLEGSVRPTIDWSIAIVAANSHGDAIEVEQNAWFVHTLVRADGTRLLLSSTSIGVGIGGVLGPDAGWYRATGALALYEDGSVLAAVSGGLVKLASSGAVLWSAPFEGLVGGIDQLAILPDGSAVAAGSFRGGSAAWGADTLALHGVDPAGAAFVLGVTPDGKPAWSRQFDASSIMRLAADGGTAALVTQPASSGPLTLAVLDAATGAVVSTRRIADDAFQGGGTWSHVGLAICAGDVLVGGTYRSPFDFGGGVVSPASADGYVLDVAL